jgi:hypothetical protein
VTGAWRLKLKLSTMTSSNFENTARYRRQVAFWITVILHLAVFAFFVLNSSNSHHTTANKTINTSQQVSIP